MSRLVIASNRVAPVDEGKTASGGLAVAVLAALRQSGGIWFGWSGDIADRTDQPLRLVESGRLTYAMVDLTAQDHDEYYNGFANRTLWPLLHYRLDLQVFNRRDYAGYLRVNDLFAKRLAGLLRADDLVWVHDYHLIPMGAALRRAGFTGRLGFFLHTPFPASEVLRALPSHADLVRTLAVYDLVGLQTRRDAHCFHQYIVEEAGGRVGADDMVQLGPRRFKVTHFPIGLDTANVKRMALNGQNAPMAVRMRGSLGNRHLAIGVDRLDYSKGLVHRFLAYERMLDSWPQHRGRVTFMQIAPPTRSDVPEYAEIRRELQEASGRINGRFADFDWVPIRYLNRNVNRRSLTGFFRMARAALVTPLRDGMNLVAKEFVAAQPAENPGVLILSQFAGAAEQLTEALTVNPFDIDETAEVLQQALSMPHDERHARWHAMMQTLEASDVSVWRHNFIETLRSL